MKKELSKPKGYREILVDGDLIFYKVGASNVSFRWPDRSSLVAPLAGQIFPTMTWDDIEHDRWKGGFSVTPGDIEKYIRSRN